MKRIPALLASLFITALIGAAMFVVAGGALLNKNSLPVQDSPKQSAVSVSAAPAPVDLSQLQQRIQEYQSREKQYQSELNSASQQLDQANQELQQYQQLLIELQRRGVIRVDRSGQIFIPRGGGFNDDGGSQNNSSGSQNSSGNQA